MADSIQIPQPNIHTESSLIRTTDQKSTLDNKNKKDNIDPLKGGIVKKEPTFGEKLRRSFVKEDLKDIRDYIVFDMIIPNARKAFFDTIVGTAAQIFGISVPRGGLGYRSDGYSPANARLTPHERRYRDYNSISQGQIIQNSSSPRILTYDRFYVSDYPFPYKEDAEQVLEELIDICDSDGWVSVARFFDRADPNGTIEGRNVYTNNDFGWNAIDNGYIKEVPGGWAIVLPPARPRRR